MKKVGIIGCGAIGTLIATAVEKRIVPCDELVLYDCNIEKAKALKKSLNSPATLVESLEEMIKHKPAIIVEAASQQAAKDYLPRILAAKVEVIVMSVGALLDMDVESSKVHVPSGAIGGLDAIFSASLAGIEEVVLTSRKNPKALELVTREEKLVYEGVAEDAARRFPREMNVAAILALTVKPAKVRVMIIADPKVTRNTHEIKVRWKHGDMLLKFSNDPHPQNRKTSALAAWSAIGLLKRILENQS